jgi:hypothetical protein
MTLHNLYSCVGGFSSYTSISNRFVDQVYLEKIPLSYSGSNASWFLFRMRAHELCTPSLLDELSESLFLPL